MPLKGFPTIRTTAKPRRRVEAFHTFLLAGAVFVSENLRRAFCGNFFKIAAAGSSAGGLRAAFLFWGCGPDAQSRISLAAANEGGAAPPPRDFLKKSSKTSLFGFGRGWPYQRRAACRAPTEAGRVVKRPRRIGAGDTPAVRRGRGGRCRWAWASLRRKPGAPWRQYPGADPP